MTRATLSAWLLEMKAAGYWCQPCASCGAWYGQRRSARGRRSIICKLQRCYEWRRYQHRTGRAPPEWLQARWREVYGNTPRTPTKAHDEPRWCGT